MNNKTINQEAHLLYALFQKIPIAMRLSLLFMFLLVFQMHAENIHSQDTKISLSLTCICLKEGLKISRNSATVRPVSS
jgi:hypothetical protein